MSFQVWIQARISALSWRTEVWVPRRNFLVVNSANQRCILAGGGDTEGKVLC